MTSLIIMKATLLINLQHCDSIMEAYQYGMSEDRAFESLLLENYSSFILTIECKEEFTL